MLLSDISDTCFQSHIILFVWKKQSGGGENTENGQSFFLYKKWLSGARGEGHVGWRGERVALIKGPPWQGSTQSHNCPTVPLPLFLSNQVRGRRQPGSSNMQCPWAIHGREKKEPALIMGLVMVLPCWHCLTQLQTGIKRCRIIGNSFPSSLFLFAWLVMLLYYRVQLGTPQKNRLWKVITVD